MPLLMVPDVVPERVKDFTPGSTVYVKFPDDAVATALLGCADVCLWSKILPKRAKNAVVVGTAINSDIVWALHRRPAVVLDVSPEQQVWVGAAVPGLVPVSDGLGGLLFVRQCDVYATEAEVTDMSPIDLPVSAVYNLECAGAIGDAPMPARTAFDGAEDIQLEEVDDDDEEDDDEDDDEE